MTDGGGINAVVRWMWEALPPEVTTTLAQSGVGEGPWEEAMAQFLVNNSTCAEALSTFMQNQTTHAATHIGDIANIMATNVNTKFGTWFARQMDQWRDYATRGQTASALFITMQASVIPLALLAENHAEFGSAAGALMGTCFGSSGDMAAAASAYAAYWAEDASVGQTYDSASAEQTGVSPDVFDPGGESMGLAAGQSAATVGMSAAESAVGALINAISRVINVASSIMQVGAVSLPSSSGENKEVQQMFDDNNNKISEMIAEMERHKEALKDPDFNIQEITGVDQDLLNSMMVHMAAPRVALSSMALSSTTGVSSLHTSSTNTVASMGNISSANAANKIPLNKRINQSFGYRRKIKNRESAKPLSRVDNSAIREKLAHLDKKDTVKERLEKMGFVNGEKPNKPE